MIPTDPPDPMSRRLKIASGIVLALIAISGVGIAITLRQLEPRAFT